MGTHRISQAEYEKLEDTVKKIVQEKQPYERIVLTKDEAL
jgi:threonyl-tRNA synthetase